MLARRYNSVLVSGPPCSGKTSLSEALAEKTGWKVFSISDMIRERWLSEPQGNRISFEQFCRKLSHAEILRMAGQASGLAKKGEIIIDARYPVGYPETTLKIYIWASPEVRAERIKLRQEYAGLTHEERIKTLGRIERDSVDTGMGLFGIDYRDAAHYYVKLRTDHISTEEIANMLAGPLQLKWLARAAETTTAK